MRRIISLIFIGLLVVINFNLIRNSLDSSEKLEEINREQEQVKEVEKQNQQLRIELKKRESAFFIEQEARDKLDYGKSGETAIILEEQYLSEGKEENPAKSESNFQKWLNLIRN